MASTSASRSTGAPHAPGTTTTFTPVKRVQMSTIRCAKKPALATMTVSPASSTLTSAASMPLPPVAGSANVARFRGLENLPQQRRRLFQRLEKGGVLVPDEGLDQRLNHARMDVARARRHQDALGSVAIFGQIQPRFIVRDSTASSRLSRWRSRTRLFHTFRAVPGYPRRWPPFRAR